MFDGDRYAHEFVHLGHFAQDVVERLLLAGVLEEFGEVGGTVGEELSLHDEVAGFHGRGAAGDDLVRHFPALLALAHIFDIRHHGHNALAVLFADVGDMAGDGRDDGRVARGAALEDLFHARETLGHVAADGCGTAFVLGAHRELGARFADGLRRDGADHLIYIPFVNRLDLLDRAVESVRGHRRNLAILDQSEHGIGARWDTDVAVYRMERKLPFSVMMNWALDLGRDEGVRYLCFMHNDAECVDDAATGALASARERDDARPPPGAPLRRPRPPLAAMLIT